MRIAVLLVLVTACAGRAGEWPLDGTEGGHCYGNDTCDEGLLCSTSALCVQPGVITDDRCGDYDLDPTEECDDGNKTEGDGCDAVCHLEDQGPGGDGCADARQLTLVPVAPGVNGAVASGNLLEATSSADAACGGNGAPDHIYSFNLWTTADVVVSVAPRDSIMDPVLEVRGVGAVSCASSTAMIDCSDQTDPTTTESLTLDAAASGFYYIIVDSFPGEAGLYSLEIMVDPL